MGDPRAALSAADLARWREVALDLVGEASIYLLKAFKSVVEAERKADGSLVTAADREVERRFREGLARRCPGHGLVGEEWPDESADRDFVWIMDPIDGTAEFVHRVPLFGSILGLHFRGQPVVGVIDHPALGLRLAAAYGAGTWLNAAPVRRRPPTGGARMVLSSRENFERMDAQGFFDRLVVAYPDHRIYRSCYAHTCAAIGNVDFAVEYGNRLWDFAATRILVEEAGGVYAPVSQKESAAGTYYGAAFGDAALVHAAVALAHARR